MQLDKDITYEIYVVNIEKYNEAGLKDFWNSEINIILEGIKNQKEDQKKFIEGKVLGWLIKKIL